MKTRTQNFDVPLNSSSVPSQMFALSEGQTYFSWPAVHRSTSSGEKKTCRHRERRAMISFIILCLWRKSGTQLQTVSPGRLSLRCIRLLTLKKKKDYQKRATFSPLHSLHCSCVGGAGVNVSCCECESLQRRDVGAAGGSSCSTIQQAVLKKHPVQAVSGP